MSLALKTEGLDGRKWREVEVPKRDGDWEVSMNAPFIGLNHGNLEDVPKMIRPRMIGTNISGRRGVVPCKGVWGYDRTLRKEGPDLLGGIHPHQGTGRHQKKGLAYADYAPLNKPLFPLFDSYQPALKSSIPNIKG